MIEIRQLQKDYQDFHLDCSLRVEDGMSNREITEVFQIILEDQG